MKFLFITDVMSQSFGGGLLVGKIFSFKINLQKFFPFYLLQSSISPLFYLSDVTVIKFLCKYLCWDSGNHESKWEANTSHNRSLPCFNPSAFLIFCTNRKSSSIADTTQPIGTPFLKWILICVDFQVWL